MIKSFSIFEFTDFRKGCCSVTVHYVSGAFREYTLKNICELPSTILEAINSGDFKVAQTRISPAVFAQYFERV